MSLPRVRIGSVSAAGHRGSTLIALTLSIGMCVALNGFVFAVLWDAIASQGPGLSSNATQILASWGSGVIGVIGTVVGYGAGVAGEQARTNAFTEGQQAAAAPNPPSPGAVG